MSWIDDLSAHARRGEACVVVTVVAVDGSGPREPGAKMIVATQGFSGTIGGGHLEFEAQAIARKLLAEGARAPSLREFSLGPALGQCCGGRVSLLFEPVRSERFAVVVCGAGHVGRAVVAALSPLPECKIFWLDEREDAFPETVAGNVTVEAGEAGERAVGQAPAGAFYLVMTHSHALDLRLCEAILRRGDFRFLGLIGSATKAARFRQRLAARGFAPELVARMVSPIGLPGVGGKHPAEIAVAVAAQLVGLRSQTEAAAMDKKARAQASGGEGKA